MPSPAPFVRPGQQELPFHLTDREWYSVRRAAFETGMSESFVEKLFDAGTQLSGHVHNAGAGLRETKRIPRVWLIAYLLQTARYDLDALVGALAHSFRRLSTPLLERIYAAIQAELKRRAA